MSYFIYLGYQSVLPLQKYVSPFSPFRRQSLTQCSWNGRRLISFSIREFCLYLRWSAFKTFVVTFKSYPIAQLCSACIYNHTKSCLLRILLSFNLHLASTANWFRIELKWIFWCVLFYSRNCYPFMFFRCKVVI